MTRDYYRPVIAFRIVNYIDGEGVARHHALQFRREHSDQWLEVPVLNKPYGSDSTIDTDMAGYEYDSKSESESVDDLPDTEKQWDHNPFANQAAQKERIEYLEHFKHLEYWLKEKDKECLKLRDLVEELQRKIMTLDDRYYRSIGKY